MEYIETKRDEGNKAAWLEKRRHYITGTDAGKLIGVSPWGGEFSVWLDKTGRAAPIAETPAMRAGKAFEASILKMYAEETDCRLEHVDGYNLITSGNFPRLGASLDGWNHDLQIPVDAKNIRWKDEKWGDSYTSDFPEYYKAQLQVQMMVTGANFAHLAVMFSGQDFFIYQMEYDHEMEKKILEAAEAFWPYVENDQMPNADGAENTGEFIKENFAEGDPEKEISPTDELKELVTRLSRARKAEAKAKAEAEEIANRIKIIMGKSSIVTGLCTWKNDKSSVKVEWESVAREAMAGLKPEQKTELIDRYTKLVPGKRPLKITAKEL